MNESPQLTRLVMEAEREKGVVELDCAKTEAWSPFGVAFIASCFAVRKRAGYETSILVPTKDADAAELLEATGLSEYVQGDSVVLDEWEDRVIDVADPTSTEDIASQLASPLSAATAKAPLVVKPCFSALIDNLRQWSESPVGGFVVVRWQKRSHKVKVAIVDRGIGIPASLRRSPASLFHRSTDVEIIEAAFTDPSVTSKVQKDEAGSGLKNLRDAVLSHRGKLTVVSLGAKVVWSQEKLTKTSSPALHGTAIEIEIQA
jgi:signal transduction histidine kinase